MNTPFSADQFLEVFKNYNLAVFPMQFIFYLLALACVYSAVRPNTWSNKIISGILSFLWLWMGVVYHLIFFSGINKAAFAFGSIFILQGLLFLIAGEIKKKLSFSFKPDVYGITGIILIFFALVAYPGLGYFLGHKYPSSPTFGLPCPTTIFTFGMLLMIAKKCPLWILIIPLLWSLIGFTAAFKFGIVEDTGLVISGVFTFIALLSKNRIYYNNK